MRGLSSWVRFRKSRRISASDTSEVRLGELVVDCDAEPRTLGLPPRFRGSTMMYPRKSATERVRPGTGVSQCGVLYPSSMFLCSWYSLLRGTAICVAFGQAGDVRVVGGWTGTGHDRIRVFRDGVWFLDLNGNGQ